MNEKLFQFIWQQLKFDQRNLFTTKGEIVNILYQGTLNADQGPDFLNARLRINETLWAGSVELHIKESDWKKHGHTNDVHYDNVILHVVLDADCKEEERILPTISLEGRISKSLLETVSLLRSAADDLPCKNLLGVISNEDFEFCNQRMLLEKWNDKCLHIFQSLKECNFHFDEALWRMIASNFGTPVNNSSFETIAASIPWTIVRKVADQPHALEALLLGQAGVLSKNFNDKYPLMLQKEYNFLLKKYRLVKADAPLYFLRMRPANFPTIRLVQLGAFIARAQHLFALVRDAVNIMEISEMLNVSAGGYWDNHYRPDEEAAFLEKRLGEEMKRNVLINTFLPFLYAYGRHVQSPAIMNRSMDWLATLPPENNRITRSFRDARFLNRNASDSQALIYLKKNYCNERKCLQCNLGIKMLQ